jgi:fatty-acyl-CoA synthase
MGVSLMFARPPEDRAMNTISRSPLLTAASLGEALRAASRQHASAMAYYPGALVQEQACSCAGLEVTSARYAAALREHGVRPGDLVGLVHGTGPGLLACLFGVLRAGAAVSVLPVRADAAAMSADARRAGAIIESAGIRKLVVDPRYANAVAAARPRSRPLTLLAPWAEGTGTAEDGVQVPAGLPEPEPGDLAIVQFTSGTTGNPRGVCLTHGAVLAGLRAITASAGLTPADVLVQWLPAYHDMGLFGLLGQVLNGGTAHVIDPAAFLRDPAGFLRYLSDHEATLTTGPDFAYEMLAAAGPEARRRGPLDLSRMRIAFNGAGPVHASTIQRLRDALEPAGLGPSVLFPCYGLAEATLAVSFPPVGRLPSVIHVDRAELARSGTAREVPLPDLDGADAVLSLVSVGRPVGGLQLRIADGAGIPLCDGQLGEVQIRGEAVTTGYYRDPAATSRAFAGPWFRTGDLGFMLGGELFVAGRQKEMIVVQGRNILPAEAEAAVRDMPGVYRRHCLAFRVAGREVLGIVAETALSRTEYPSLARRIHRKVSAELGLAEVSVHIVPRRHLARTTSGKWQRLRAADQLLASPPAPYGD